MAKRIGQGSDMLFNGKLNVTKEQLKESGMSLREYANEWKKTGNRPTGTKDVPGPGVEMGEKVAPMVSKFDEKPGVLFESADKPPEEKDIEGALFEKNPVPGPGVEIGEKVGKPLDLHSVKQSFGYKVDDDAHLKEQVSKAPVDSAVEILPTGEETFEALKKKQEEAEFRKRLLRMWE